MPPAKSVTEILLVLGTALTIYWQPLNERIALKPSDGLFALAVCAWMLFCAREKRPWVLRVADAAFIPPLLASILAATLIGYAHYHLGMSRTGVILLARLGLCVALFLIVRSLLVTHTSFRRWLTFAFLSPLLLFPAMLIPPVSRTMWDPIGRLQGLTVNANTADVAFLIAFSIACALAADAAGTRRPERAVVWCGIAAGMLALILLTQSRAYFLAAFASALLGAALAAGRLRLPRLKLVVATALSFMLAVAAIFLLGPRHFLNAYLIRLSPVYRTFEPSDAPRAAPSTPQPPGTARKLQRFLEGGAQKIEGDTRVSAIRYYARLLSTNWWGLGLNYETKFTVVDPETGIHHGTNTILDIPVYGGIGAVLSIAYLAVLVGRKIARHLAAAREDTVPYTIGAVTALGGLWAAAILVGSPIFDYQFWILTAVALAEPVYPAEFDGTP